MNRFAILGLLATKIYLTMAAAVPEHASFAANTEKRVESTFAWKEYFVRNCTTPCLAASDDGDMTINGEDCKNLSTWQSGNNGGYYELWDFNNFNNLTYRPVVGHDTCVVALSHAETNIPDDYAIMGSLDVIDLVASTLSLFQVDGRLPTIFGDFTCGPNLAPLSILIYNGFTGWEGTPILSDKLSNSNYTAVPTSMKGPAASGSYTTGLPPPVPVVTVAPAGQQGDT